MFEQIRLAEAHLERVAHRTPVLTSRTLDKQLGTQVLLKCENYQKTGAFKFRGAFNAIKKLSDCEKMKGIIAYSSGNHGQAVALVGSMEGIKTTIVVPNNVPETKRVAIQEYGASVVTYNPETEDRLRVTEELAAEHDYTVLPPSDQLNVIAGQGTVALELFKEVNNLDMVLVPCGGGSILCSTAIAASSMASSCKVIGVEPELADDGMRSFYSRTLQHVHNPQTIADGVRTPHLGQHTFPLILKHVAGMVTVSEAAIAEAVRFLFHRMKLVVEPSAALGVAALLEKRIEMTGRIGVILTGGNIDADSMVTILKEPTRQA